MNCSCYDQLNNVFVDMSEDLIRYIKNFLEYTPRSAKEEEIKKFLDLLEDRRKKYPNMYSDERGDCEIHHVKVQGGEYATITFEYVFPSEIRLATHKKQPFVVKYLIPAIFEIKVRTNSIRSVYVYTDPRRIHANINGDGTICLGKLEKVFNEGAHSLYSLLRLFETVFYTNDFSNPYHKVQTVLEELPTSYIQEISGCGCNTAASFCLECEDTICLTRVIDPSYSCDCDDHGACDLCECY